MRSFQSKSALLTLLVVGFVSLFAVGCGSDRDEFVFTGTNNASNANLVFRFDRQVMAQSVQPVTTVPAETVRLRFDFFTSNPPTIQTLLETETRPFNEIITFNNMSTAIKFVSVTALDNQGVPLAVYTAAVELPAGATVDVDLTRGPAVTFDALTATPDPVNLLAGESQQMTLTGAFSVGNPFALDITNATTTFTAATANVANISPTGLVSVHPDAAVGLNTTVTAEYTVLGTTKTDTFQVNTYGFDVITNGLNLTAPGVYDSLYTVRFVDSNGIVTANVAADATYQLEAPKAGVSVASDGVVTLTSDATDGVFNVIVTWVDDNAAISNANGTSGVTFRKTVPFTVDASSVPM